MTYLFVHGWGFDAQFWSALAPMLPGQRLIIDRGYFGAPCQPVVSGPVVAVTHSFGAMRVLRDPPEECRALIAINGFDMFVARKDAPGVPPRVVDRMITRFGETPEIVVGEFRRRCGAEAVTVALCRETLAQDLLQLREMDCREDSKRASFPILSLQGGADPILAGTMVESVFANAARVARATRADAGHLLPLSDPAWCARAVSGFLDGIA